MGLKQQIDQDLKAAMLGGDKTLATTLRGLKSAILYVEVAKGQRDNGLPDADIIAVLQKESKKRQESADLYIQGGNKDRAEAELAERQAIERYLPKQLTDEELNSLIDKVIEEIRPAGLQAMGQVISMVKLKTNGTADGAKIASLVKAKLSS
jgi:uncharacterized protein